MIHQSGKKKLNLKPSHKRSLLRNQVIHFISYGHLITTKPTVKEVQRLAEKLVTLARSGKNFNAFRQVKALLPYKDEAIEKLFAEIAPRYVDRNGGYTRVISLGRRVQDMAPIAKIEWV